MKPTKTQQVKHLAEQAGFALQHDRHSPQMVWLVRVADKQALGLVHRFAIPAWLRGEKLLVDKNGKTLPPFAQAKVAA